MDLILTQPAVSGSGTDVTVVDESPPLGTFFYAVVAYNAGGDTWSAPSNTIVSEGCPPAGPVAVEPLVVEILELETEESFDKLYCYASLAGSPFERVPYGASNFITLEAGEWNIAEHFSGVNRREVYAPSAGPLIISGECLGWQGEELIRIGLFNDSSMPEEWDGRLLNAGMLGGTGFNFTYRVNHSFHAAEESGRAAWPVVNPDIPAPFDLRTSSEWVECPEDVRLCARREEPALLWRWEYPGGVTPDEFAPRYYKVYRRLAGQPVPVLHFTTESHFTAGPLLRGRCSEVVFYSVSAVVRPDPVTGGERQSPLSEELEVPPTCASLEITLDFLWVYGVNDGDPCTIFDDCRNDYEAYGWMSFNGQRVIWNDHCDPGFLEGCLTSGPSYSRVLEASEHSWSSLSLNTGDGFRRNNNVITIPIRDGESLDFRLTFRDHDSGSADDLWCGGTRRNVISEGPHSAAEWLAFNQSLEYDGNCIVHFTVRGIPAE
jgi:hypothetical protein